MRADDSDGMIGDLARRVLDLHREACVAGVADPQALAKWIVRFCFEDQDFFEVDPVAYVGALGEKGLTVYRHEVAKRSDPGDVPEDRVRSLRDMYAGDVATAGDCEISSAQWLRLAGAREPGAPADAMAVYLRLADDVLARADKRAYRDAVRHLKVARRAATAADRLDEFTEHLTDLRERNRRRPSFMAMLDKAGLQ